MVEGMLEQSKDTNILGTSPFRVGYMGFPGYSLTKGFWKSWEVEELMGWDECDLGRLKGFSLIVYSRNKKTVSKHEHCLGWICPTSWGSAF